MRVLRFILLALPLAAIAIVFAYGARSAEYVINGSFERDGRPWLGNWKGHNARLSSVPGGAVGRFAVRVTKLRGKGEFALIPTGSPVTSTVAGQRYNASALVRSFRPGPRVVLLLREWEGNRLVGFARRSLAPIRSWERFDYPTISYRAKGSGHRLDLALYVRGAHDGDQFDVDDASLAEPLTADQFGADHVLLEWSATAGADHYAVYRGDLLIGTTRERTFFDALLWPETTYAYRVDALSKDGDVLASRAASATTRALRPEGLYRPFPASSFWNTPVPANARVDPRSKQKIAYFLSNLRYPNLTLHAFAVPVAEAHLSDPRLPVRCTRYECTLQAFGRVPTPLTAQPDPESDGHLAIYYNGREWDMWQAVRGDRSWSASAGAAVSLLRGNGLAPPGTAGANAANFPLLAGIVRPEEIFNHRIDHALVFTMPRTGRGRPVCPATHNGGSVTDPNALRQGQHLQLDPDLDLSTLDLPAWEEPILRALQVYGMYLRDQGGTLAIYGENPISRGYDAWALASPELDTPLGAKQLTGIPWERFRVLAAPDGPRCR